MSYLTSLQALTTRPAMCWLPWRNRALTLPRECMLTGMMTILVLGIRALCLATPRTRLKSACPWLLSCPISSMPKLPSCDEVENCHGLGQTRKHRWRDVFNILQIPQSFHMKGIVKKDWRVHLSETFDTYKLLLTVQVRLVLLVCWVCIKHLQSCISISHQSCL